MSFYEIVLLYIAFRFKQLTCDFFLQTSWMALTKGNPLKEGGWHALLAHAGVHAVGTLVVTLIFAPSFWGLAAADLFIHGAIDKLKARINRKFGWTYTDPAYWWAFGLDQEAHNLTHLGYIILILGSTGISAG